MPRGVRTSGMRKRLHVKGDMVDDFDSRNVAKFKELIDGIVSSDGCKIWPLSCNSLGTPVFCLIGGKRIGADRYAATLYIRPPILKEIVIHTCGDMRCVNAAHLRWGSRSDRQRRMVASGRGFRPETIGEHNPAHRLREEDVAFIRSSALSQRKLAKLFNVAVTTISMCQLGRTWGHLPGAREFTLQPVPYESPRYRKKSA